MQNTKQYVVIPARYKSSRFPGKPLAPILGYSMLERVWKIAQQATKTSEVIIATDHEKIAQHAEQFGAKVMMTPESCQNGTERVYECIKNVASPKDIVLSLQGDAVLTPPWVIDDLIDSLQQSESYGIATPAQTLTDKALEKFLAHKKVSPSSGTCVTVDKHNQALYFSKQVIPYAHGQLHSVLRHIGLYAYRFETLTKIQDLEPTPLEQIEKLEQLRALENNIPIKVVCVDYRGRTHASVDTPQDVQFVESIIQAEGELVL